MPAVADGIRAKLENALSPELLEIIDDSHRHAGHAGANPLGESHFTVRAVAAVFAGKSRVERQRLVYSALAEEMAGRVHALALVLRAPGEPG